MAKHAVLKSKWMRASELHLVREESKADVLELPKLKLFIPNGLQRGSLIEINGPKSSGKTSTSLYILSVSIKHNETCAYIDLKDQFDPSSLLRAGVSLDGLAWIKCHGNTEHAMRSADLILHGSGFGLVLLDLCGVSPKDLNRIPLSYWFRFKRAIEKTPTILLICSEHPQSISCSSLSLNIRQKKFRWTEEPPFSLLEGLEAAIVPRKSANARVTSIRPDLLYIQTPHMETVGV